MLARGNLQLDMGNVDRARRNVVADEAPTVSLSTDDWPIVRLVFAGAVTPTTIQTIILELLTLANRAAQEHRRMGLLALLDALDPRQVSAGMRKEHAVLLRELLPRLAAATCAEARVVTHPLVRGVLTAMGWILPHPWTVEVFSNEHDAKRWLETQCAQSRSLGPQA
ncbi:MAG: hypothetical protein ABW321_02230 [Polyangiales bacterium]